MRRRDYNPHLLNFARDMRKQPTEAERKLWALLRNGRLSGLKFRRQHPIAGYILDFYCETHRLAVEADGGQHTSREGAAYNRARELKLREHGIRVVRFSDYDVLKSQEAVARTILREVGSGVAKQDGVEGPHPSPLPKGEGARGDVR